MLVKLGWLKVGWVGPCPLIVVDVFVVVVVMVIKIGWRMP